MDMILLNFSNCLGLILDLVQIQPVFSCTTLAKMFEIPYEDSSAGKESACIVGDPGSIPGLGRSPGEGKGYPLQYSGLENSMDCTVHGLVFNAVVTKGHKVGQVDHTIKDFLLLLL